MRNIFSRYGMYLVFGLVALVLFHFESLYVAGVKISHLWKSVLLFFLVSRVFNRSDLKLYMYRPLILLAIVQIASVEIINDTVTALYSFATLILLAVSGIYAMRFDSTRLKDCLFVMGVLLTVVFIPYQMGIIDSITDGYDLENYGLAAFGLVGPFQNVHGASIALASACLVNLYFWFEGSYNRKVLLICLVMGLFFLLNVYVRTGLAMVLAGALPLVLHFARGGGWFRFKVATPIIVVAAVVGGVFASNQVMLDRFSGKGVRHVESTLESLGSGRVGLYLASAKIFYESSPLEKVFGMGQKELRDRTALITGSRTLSHNGFILVLLSNGVVGLFLLLWFFKNVYRIRYRVDRDRSALVSAMFFAYVVMSFVQNYDVFYFNIVLVVAIAYVLKDAKERGRREISA